MICQSCDSELSSESRFCSSCGAPVLVICTKCQHPNHPNARFCAVCGTRLQGWLATAVQHIPLKRSERRLVTVMFCDLVDSTPLSVRLDPEDLRHVIRAYQVTVAGVIERFRGFVARYVGDGVLSYFGWPEADETDAERAIRAALSVISEVAQIVSKSERCHVRIGIATGVVVIGEPVVTDAAQQQVAFGATPNRAARLQHLAGPGTVLVDEATRHQVGGLFDCVDLGEIVLKGLPESTKAWQVRGETVIESRFKALRGRRSLPLIGRNDEHDFLLGQWRRAQTAAGSAVLISGGAGIGKSRLIAAVVESLGEETHRTLWYSFSPHTRESALHPIITELVQEAEFVPGEPGATKFLKLQALLARNGTTADDIALFAEMLLVPLPEHVTKPSLSPRRKREMTFDAIIHRLQKLALTNPILVLFEDAHWADPSSLDLLSTIIHRLDGLRALVVISFRPEYQPPWINEAGVSLLSLNRLNRHDAIALIDELPHGRLLPPDCRERIISHADGVPLFIEELAETAVEATLKGTNPTLAQTAVPTTLQASLVARLDRLPSAKWVSQVGAVIGRDFAQPLVLQLSGLSDEDLEQGLQELTASGLAFRRESASIAVYTFKHALVRDAAYSLLLREVRQDLHARLVSIYKEQYPDILERQIELLAYHCANAGLEDEAITYWILAAQRSIAGSALAEAIAQLREALALLQKAPQAPARWQQEVQIQSMLGGALFASQGHKGQEAQRALIQAEIVGEKVGDVPQLVRILAGQVTYHIGEADYVSARQIADRIQVLAHGINDSEVDLIANRCYAVVSHWTGDFRGALHNCKATIRLYEPQRHHGLATVVGFDVLTQAVIFGSTDLLLLGYPDEARRWLEDGLSGVRTRGHHHSLAFALVYGAMVHIFCRNAQAAMELLEEAVSLATEQRFPHWLALANIVRGPLLGERGNPVEALASALQGFDTYSDTGATYADRRLILNKPFYFGQIACTYAVSGLPDRAIAYLDEAIDAADRTGERWFEPELHRMKGELYASRGEKSEAGGSFVRAIDLARNQGSRLWEIRALMALARINAAVAIEPLAIAISDISGGLDLPDVAEARSLLRYHQT